MKQDPEHPPRDTRLEALEAELRRLPKPSLSPDLEGKLLANIPATAPYARSRTRWCQAVGIAGIAVTVTVFVLARIVTVGDASRTEPTGASELLSDTSPRYILARGSNLNVEETRPCDILPPLPE